MNQIKRQDDGPKRATNVSLSVSLAIAEYLERNTARPIDSAFGLWGKAGPDGLKHQPAMRDEW